MQSTQPAAGQGSDHILLVGRDTAGHWIVQETGGLLEGLFVSREAALHFAHRERRHWPAARIEMAAGPLSSLLAA